MKYLSYIYTLFIFLNFNMANCQEWKQVDAQFDPPGLYHINGAKFTDKETCWFFTHVPSILFKTTDGCKTFNSQFVDDSLSIWSIDFIDGYNGWVLAENENNKRSFIYRTRNNGISWTKTSLELPLSPIKFLDTLNGIGGHRNSRSIYWTDDGGISWQPAELPDSNRFEIIRFEFTSKANGAAIGYDNYATDTGLLLMTADGGRTWRTSLEDIAPVSGIAFADSLNGCIVPMWVIPIVYTTIDGGDTWNTYIQDIAVNLLDIDFENDSVAWAVGYSKILKSSDKGVTWTRIEGMPEYNYYQVIFLRSEKVGYILGSSSSIFKYDMTPVSVKEDHKIDKKYALCPNYPNPFNSTTVISYELKVNSDIRLSVFDLNGREIKTLINGHQSAGIYHVPFHAAGLASGVYCYKIKAGRFVQTKKMLLIR